MVQHSPSKPHRSICLSGKTILGILGALALTLVCVSPVDPVFKGAFLVLYCAISWSTGLLPNWLVAFAIFVIASVTQLAPTTEVLSGFTSSAVWLVLGGLFIGAAIEYTGLASVIAHHISPYLFGRPVKTLVSVVLLCTLTVFIMPSAMGRAVLMAPILMSLADSLGFKRGSDASTGVILGGTISTFFPAFSVLPANVPNNVLMGCMHDELGLSVSYLDYFIYHFPILGTIKILSIILFICLFYRKALKKEWEEMGVTPEMLKVWETQDVSELDPESVYGKIATQSHEGLVFSQKIMIVVLVCTLVLWCTESVHGISVAWISMIAALICLIPGIGLMPAQPFSRVNLTAFFYVAGVLSMGTLANSTGFGQKIINFLVEFLPFSPQTPFISFLLLAFVAMVMSVLVTAPGSPAILTPLAQQLAHATGFSLPVVCMTQVVGFSTILLPYQSANLIVACQMINLPTSKILYSTSFLAILSILFAWPLDYLWWCFIGLIG